MSRGWDTENGSQATAFPRVGVLSLPEEPLGEKGQGVVTISLPYGVLLVLVDGTSRVNESRGKAQRTAVQAMRRVTQNARLNPEDVMSASDLLRQAIQAANADLHQLQRGAEDSGEFSASCALVLVTRGRSYVAHVGNARAYLVRNNAPNRLTRDHTTAQTWIDHGIMTEEQAKERPEAHSLARALGEKARVEPDVRTLPLRMEKGDVLLLCSVGVHRYLEDDAMGSMVARLEPEHACHELCAVASTRSKTPDCKTLVYQSGPLRPGNYPRLLQQRRKRRQRKYAGLSAAVVALVVLAVGAFYFFGPTSGRPGDDSKEPFPDVHLLSQTALAETISEETLTDVVSPQTPDLVVSMEMVPETIEVEDVQSVRPEVAVPPDIQEQVEDSAQDVSLVVEVVAAVASTVEKVPVHSAVEPAPLASVKLRTAEPVWAMSPSKKNRERCHGKELERGDRRRARDLRHLVRNGLKFLEGSKKNASSAAKQAKAAAKTLRGSSKVVRDRCTDHVMDLRNIVKARYLHLSWVSATRAMDNLDQRTVHCAKSFRMSRDAQRLGATDEELKEARRICGKE
jgi:serine/threonine protein phosphatase PrpC